MIYSSLVADSHDPKTEANPTSGVSLFAGTADRNASLFRRIGLPLGDPSSCLLLPSGESIGIVRDLEMDRVIEVGQLSHVHCPADFQPDGRPLSGDRETAVAQATAEYLKRQGFTTVRGDRTLPLIYTWHLVEAGIRIEYDDELGVKDRRAKTADEIVALRQAQHVTEQVMLSILRMIATAEVNEDGLLMQDNHILTSERVRVFASRAFMDRGFTMTHGAIVASVPEAADCHHAGSGPLRTRVPIIVDLFPRDDASRYHGDCTRTVVHGEPSSTVKTMHEAVTQAKLAAEAQLYPGRTAEQVHRASEDVLLSYGYLSRRGQLTDEPSIQHGTGHGIGLEIHEPILLDDGGGEMLDGEVFTVEPGLYGRQHGGIRVEDMLVVTENGAENLNDLPHGLDWR